MRNDLCKHHRSILVYGRAKVFLLINYFKRNETKILFKLYPEF